MHVTCRSMKGSTEIMFILLLLQEKPTHPAVSVPSLSHGYQSVRSAWNPEDEDKYIAVLTEVLHGN